MYNEWWKCYDKISDEKYTSHVYSWNKKKQHAKLTPFGCTEDDFEKVVKL